jgi:hypothetical protein
MDANQSMSHLQHEKKRAPPPKVHINNVQLPQEEEVRRLTWNKHIFVKWKQLGIILTKMYCLLGCKSELSTNNKLLKYKTILNQSGPTEYNSGVQLPFPT